MIYVDMSHSSTIWFSWTFLMAYSKEKLKINVIRLLLVLGHFEYEIYQTNI
jgi:hypothetical protein